jgi:TM2 domain-containing membrane protein YozV
MKPNLISMIPSIDGEELVYLQALTHELNDQELMNFASAYNGKRRTSDQVLIGCIFGYVGIAGIQRFMVRQNVMGILFLFTAGFCFIGTIIDTINHRRLTFEYNQQMARESMAMMYAYR